MFKVLKTQTKTSNTIEHVATGFASPAQEFLENKLDLNTLICPHPESTFFVKLSELSIKTENISPNDLLVVDRSLDPSTNSMILAVINSEFEIGYIKTENNLKTFVPESPNKKLFTVSEDHNFQIWGVITHIIRQL